MPNSPTLDEDCPTRYALFGASSASSAKDDLLKQAGLPSSISCSILRGLLGWLDANCVVNLVQETDESSCFLHNLKGASIGRTDVGFLQLLPLSAPLYCLVSAVSIYDLAFGNLGLLAITAPFYKGRNGVVTYSAVDTALADSECHGLASSDVRMSCFINKALVHVGSELAKLVLGRVSTEVDACLALLGSSHKSVLWLLIIQ
ncbi:unnamed protein product [Camellia sinensis]